VRQRPGFRWEYRKGCQCKFCPWKGNCRGEDWPHWIEVKIMEWQPIETAPKDGINILVVDARVRELWAVASWDADEPSTAKWCTLDGAYHQDRFTHWMPLPSPPQAVSQTK
jgi:hypothetical protein